MGLAEQLWAVVLVLGLLCGGLWVLRNRGLATFRFRNRIVDANRQLRVLDRVPLSASHSLHVVQFADRVLLIGIAPSGCTLLESSKSVTAIGVQS